MSTIKANYVENLPGTATVPVADIVWTATIPSLGDVPTWDGSKWILTPPSGTPTGPAGGVLAGTYPDPGFAEDMATQVELDAAIATREPEISAGATTQYWRGDKSWQTLDKTAVGLGNVDNTADLNKPISNATAEALGNNNVLAWIGF